MTTADKCFVCNDNLQDQFLQCVHCTQRTCVFCFYDLSEQCAFCRADIFLYPSTAPPNTRVVIPVDGPIPFSLNIETYLFDDQAPLRVLTYILSHTDVRARDSILGLWSTVMDRINLSEVQMNPSLGRLVHASRQEVMSALQNNSHLIDRWATEKQQQDVSVMTSELLQEEQMRVLEVLRMQEELEQMEKQEVRRRKREARQQLMGLKKTELLEMAREMARETGKGGYTKYNKQQLVNWIVRNTTTIY